MSPSPLQTEAEIKMVKRYLVLIIMMDLLEIEARRITSHDDLKTANLIKRKFKLIQKGITKLLHSVHQEFRTHGIKMIKEVRNRTYVEAEYLCRGYRHEMILQGDIIKAEIDLQMAIEFGIDLLDGDVR